MESLAQKFQGEVFSRQRCGEMAGGGRLSLGGRSDPELEAVADGMIEIIERRSGQMDI